MARRIRQDLRDHEKYGALFRIVDKYGGGIEEWTKKNRKISRALRLMR